MPPPLCMQLICLLASHLRIVYDLVSISISSQLFFHFMNNGLSLENLHVFCAAVRTLNFSQAAQSLGTTPGYVSKRIQALEKQLGCRLFHRSTRHVTLTEQGEWAYKLGMRILDNAQELQEQIAVTKNEPKGVLRVATSLGFGRKIVGQALEEFSARYPDIQVVLDLVDHTLDLIENQIDLDIRIGDEISPNYIARKLATNYRVLCAAPSYIERMSAPKQPQELFEHECLVIKERDHPVGLWKLMNRKNSDTYSIKVSGPLITNHGEIAVSWALDGRGIILRSIWDIKEHLDSGALVQVLPDLKQEANIWAVYPERLSSSAKIKFCVRHLQDFFSRWNTDQLKL